MDQQGQSASGGHVPPPIAPNPPGMDVTQQQAISAPNQGVASHLMGLMTNPALAAAAAASPVFPPAAMLTNPGAFFAMPDVIAQSGAVRHGGSASTSVPTVAAPGGMVLPQIQPAIQTSGGNVAQVYSNGSTTSNGGQQAAHLQPGQTSQPQIPGNMGAQQMQMRYVGLPMHPIQPNTSAMQIQMAASSAAEAAAAMGNAGDSGKVDDKGKRKKDLSPAERAKQNRDRNREHARSTRLRKKAYVQKLKELVEGLHAERTEEVRQRRVAIQHLAEMQNVRRAVVRSFLRFHAVYERDKRKWCTILEDSFWLKQPVTPYRCFRRGEIENDCRIAKGVDGVLADAASLAVMIEGVGSRTSRWMQIKREEFFIKEEERTGIKRMPRDIVEQNNRFQHAMSSLSSSSTSSNKDSSGSSGEEANQKKKQRLEQPGGRPKQANAAGISARAQAQGANGEQGLQNISNSSGSSSESPRKKQRPSEAFHDYHAQPLPDPKLADSERSTTSASEDSPEDSNNGSADGDGKRVSTDSSDDSAAAIKSHRPPKRRKDEMEDKAPCFTVTTTGAGNNLPQNIAKKGGITHSVRPVIANQIGGMNGSARLATAPAIPLPPFAGIGKRPQVAAVTASVPKPPAATSTAPGAAPTVPSQASAVGSGGSALNEPSSVLDGPAVISGDVETSSSNSSRSRPQIRAYYHVNEDDMILMDDILMCPFVFRTQDAVMCGALAECVMPGMLRGHFSQRNKLVSVEMVYDAMGFMQQLERASGSEARAQIIPGSLEMALTPSHNEARVISLAEKPNLIVNVNETWTRMTKYTQMEAEGVELFTLLQGEGTDESSVHNLEEVKNGRCTCSTRLHYDKEGKEYVDFIASYPLTNSSDEITHILHVSKELPIHDTSNMEEIS